MVLNNKDPTFLPFLHSSSRLPSFFFLCFILSQLIVTAISINQLPDQHVMNFIQSSSTIESHLYKKSRMMHKGKSNTAREVNFTATAAAKSNGVKKSYLLQTNQTKVYANRTSNLTLLSQSHGDKSPQATTSVDCVVSWGDWSVCSTACGTGTQTRTGMNIVGVKGWTSSAYRWWIADG